jgi:hypothetical protein
MSRVVVPRAVIRGGGFGDNTVEIDGWRVPMVARIEVISDAQNLTRLRLEIIASVDYQDIVDMPEPEVPA